MIGAGSLGVLSDDDRQLLAVFVSTQMQRGPNPRQSMLAMNQELRRVLKGRFGIEDGDFPELTAEEAKAMTMKSLTEPQKFAEHILNKAWLMFETLSAHPFFIGDSPVTLQNNTQPKVHSAETLASPYAESRFISRAAAPSRSRFSAVRMRR